MNTILFADDTVLIVEHKNGLQKMADVFGAICRRRNMKVNVRKSLVMVFERSKSEVIKFA